MSAFIYADAMQEIAWLISIGDLFKQLVAVL